MNAIDVVIVVIVSLIMIAIAFAYFIYPYIIKRKSSCTSCPMSKDKKIKRAFKNYHKKNK